MKIADAFYWIDTYVSPVLIKMFWTAVYWYTAILILSAIVGVCMFLYLKWKEGRQKTTSVALVVANTPTPIQVPEVLEEIEDETGSMFGTTVLTMLVLAVILISIRFIFNDSMGSIPYRIPWWFVPLGLAIYTPFIFGTIGPDQQGLVLRLGRPIYLAKSGLVLSPPPVCTVVKATTALLQWEFPAEPEKIFYKDLKDNTLPPGMVPPIRITFGARMDDPANNRPSRIPAKDPFDKRHAATVAFTVSIRIRNLKKFVAVLGLQGGVRKAHKILQDLGEGVFNERLSQITPAAAMLELPDLRNYLRARIEQRVTGIEVVRDANGDMTEIQKEVHDWGIEITDVAIKPFGFSHELNTAVMGVSIAEQNAITKGIDAEATANATRVTGQANADEIFWTLEAEADGAQQLAQVVETPGGRTALIVETMGKAYEKGKHVIIPQNNLFGIAAGIESLLGKEGDIPDQTEPPTPTPTNNPQPTPTPRILSNNRGNRKQENQKRRKRA
ncbi:MAG: hypothetical protein RL292_476 [Candidatus Parcubacteria bacterium]